MNLPRRLCFPLTLTLIAIALVSPSLADDDSVEKAAADLAQATDVRDLALRNYRSNYATLKGVQCKISSTITTNLGLLARQNQIATDIVDDRVIHVPTVNGVQQSRPGAGVLADNDSHDDGRDEEDGEEDDSPIVRVRAIGLSKRVVDIAAGTSISTNEHRVSFCGPNVRNERYVGDTLEDRLIRNGIECRCESTTVYGAFGTPLVTRGKIGDPSIRSGPIIDPRDFGASSGVGRLEEMLATWDAVSANSGVVKCGRSGLVAIKLQERIAAREDRNFTNECVLYLDPQTSLLPVVAEHYQQHRLWQVIEITYAKCDWLPETCYLATEAMYAMPADPEKTNYSSVAEINAHSRQRFVVSEAVAFEPADNDKMFQFRSTKTMWSNGFESTSIAAPPELQPAVD